MSCHHAAGVGSETNLAVKHSSIQKLWPFMASIPISNGGRAHQRLLNTPPVELSGKDEWLMKPWCGSGKTLRLLPDHQDGFAQAMKEDRINKPRHRDHEAIPKLDLTDGGKVLLQQQSVRQREKQTECVEVDGPFESKVRRSDGEKRSTRVTAIVAD